MADTQLFKGDSLTINIAVTDGSGAAVDLSGALAAEYGIFGGAEQLVTKELDDGVTIAGNVVTVNLLPADTALLTPGRYVHELEVKDALGKVHTVLQGHVLIKRDYILSEAP